jgi:hypothetical protein
MGQQIAVAATSVDEESLLAFLRESAYIQMFRPSAATVEDLWVDRFAPYDQYHTQYFIWNKAYAWKPEFGWVNEDVEGHGGWRFVSNRLRGPVIEFDRTNVDRFLNTDLATVQYGRIYWAKYNRQKGFVKWFEAILRWVRRTGTNLHPKSSYGFYCLPDALRLWQSREAIG